MEKSKIEDLHRIIRRKSKILPSTRCPWSLGDPLMTAYHDTEWGVPVHDDRLLFEFLILEGAQAGLSWLTILKRRESYREAFAAFDPEAVARFGPREIESLMGNPGVIRNRLKIEGAVKNAKAFLAVREEHQGFAPYIWSFVGGRPIVNRPRPGDPLPATSPQSDAMSKDLKKRGFTFVGSTICYAFMQATGMVNDHVRGCFRAAPGGRSSTR
jgi:DNA-3-methyladenine glycosylase I